VSDLEQLLELQSKDTMTEQLGYRRERLAERDELIRLAGRAVAIDEERSVAVDQRHELQRSQKRREDEVATIEGKVKDTEKTLYSGSVSSPKELGALQSEIAAMRARQSDLEDGILESMEALEALGSHLEALDDEQAALVTDQGLVAARLASTEAEIDEESSQVRSAREELVSSLPAPLVERYEKLRTSLGGVAVARLSGDVCTSCHLSLPSVEVARVKKARAEEPVSCVECGAILVR